MPDLTAIAAQWGTVDHAPKLIAERENVVYEATIDGQRLALRLHRAGYQSRAAIESELTWTARLAEVGFPCARPTPMPTGALLLPLDDGRHASAVSWIDGREIGDSLDDPNLPDTALSALFHAIGALLAALHSATDAVETSDLTRPAWDAEALLGPDPLWGRFWENPSLTADEADLLKRTKSAAYETLLAMESPDAGLIHADALQENILETPAGLALIDFDDAGFGYRAYDLGVAMVQHYDDPQRAMMEEALLAGYATLRPAPDRATLHLFTLCRALASCGWIISRYTDPAYTRAQADRALVCAREWWAAQG
ncbi:MAG: phosphotransferase [Pseudomonadota bacterium]